VRRHRSHGPGCAPHRDTAQHEHASPSSSTSPWSSAGATGWCWAITTAGGLTAFRHLAFAERSAGLSQHSATWASRRDPRRRAIPNLIYASDTHYPWNEASDVVHETERFRFKDGCVELWDAPGLGVTIDEDKLAAAAEAYTTRGSALGRDDVGAMRERNPEWLPHMPKW
jgi:glucarate dehydratase